MLYRYEQCTSFSNVASVTFTETIRTIGDGSPGRPPRLSHCSRALISSILLLSLKSFHSSDVRLIIRWIKQQHMVWKKYNIKNGNKVAKQTNNSTPYNYDDSLAACSYVVTCATTNQSSYYVLSWTGGRPHDPDDVFFPRFFPPK